MLYAVADIGSNTVKYGIYEYNGDSHLPERKGFGKKTLKLVGRIRNGMLPDSDVNELALLLSEYKTKASEAGAVRFDIFATAWIRAINNSEEICAALEKAVGTRVVILSGEEEANCSNTALYAEVRPDGDGICVDMGGGSTEIVKFSGADVIARKSMPFGCVVLKDRFVAGDFPDQTEASKIADFVKNNISKLGFDIDSPLLCIVGGTAKSLLKVNRVLFGEDFSPVSFGKLFDCFMKNTDVIKALNPERIDTTLPGLIGLKTICESVTPKKVLIVSSGTREGFIMNKYRTKL